MLRRSHFNLLQHHSSSSSFGRRRPIAPSSSSSASVGSESSASVKNNQPQKQHQHQQQVTTLVLRNIPSKWGSNRAKSDIEDFIRRVFLAQPALVHFQQQQQRSSTSGDPLDNQQQQDNDDTTTPRSDNTIPAGFVPPHIRERWGMDQMNMNHTQQNEFSRGLSKYFDRSGQTSTSSTLSSSRNNNKNNNDDDSSTIVHPSMLNDFISSIKFSGERSRDTSITVKFRSSKLAKKFMKILPTYLNEVRRSRGLSIPSELVGEIEDELGVAKAISKRTTTRNRKDANNNNNEFHDEENDSEELARSRMPGLSEEEGWVCASTLDAPAADMGLYCSLHAKDQLSGLLTNATSNNNNNNDQQQQQQPLSIRETIKSDRARRKELALAIFRSVGRIPDSANNNTINNNNNKIINEEEQRQQTGNVSSSSSSLISSEPRLSLRHDGAHRPHELGNVADARSQEIQQLVGNNPLLNFEDDDEDVAVDIQEEPNNTDKATTSLFVEEQPTAVVVEDQKKSENELQNQNMKQRRRRMLIPARLMGPSLASITMYDPLHSTTSSSSSGQQHQQQHYRSNNHSKNHHLHWQDQALEEELVICNRINIDRYLMSPDLLWNVRKKYMPRRLWTSSRIKDNDGDGDEDVMAGVGDEVEEDEDVVPGGETIFAAGAKRRRRITRKEVERLDDDYEDRWKKSKKTRGTMNSKNKEEDETQWRKDNWWTTDGVFQ